MTLPASVEFPTGSAADVLRSAQKDRMYAALVAGKLGPVARIIATWLLRQPAHVVSSPLARRRISTAAELVYLVATFSAGIQTLGEEYSAIVRRGSRSRMAPSLLKRTLYILFHCFSPYFGEWIVAACKSIVKEQSGLEDVPESQISSLAAVAKWILSHELIARKTVPVLSAMHLATFYLYGTFYEVTKRIFGIEYAMTRKLRQGEAETAGGYELLGIMIFLRLAIEGLREAYQRLEAVEDEGGDDTNDEADDSLASTSGMAKGKSGLSEFGQLSEKENLGMEPLIGTSNKCILCLETRKVSTSTPCGHLFCWQCIAEWCRNKPECPLCRQSAPLPLLVPVFQIFK
ncbi:Pex12 amino terminal region-domain-containing protein [Chytriomyces sp. MP71]|nr:Pex12 amino terminal region-domain-containing protein [Chytriomyces sp. MP71]